jgi:hypothetical protein
VAKLKIQDVLDNAKACEEFYRDVYQRSSEDIAFALGKQWPDKIKKQREQDNRPCLTENRMLTFVNQVVNQIRQARPSIIPKPVDDKADTETAEVLRGVIRNIETTSDADSVYDTAARNSVMGGIGWIRIRTDYADYDSFDQEILLERIQNSASVYLDPMHQRQDGSDARYGFVYDNIDKDEFERLYPKASTEGFKSSEWYSDNQVRVAEYFYKDVEDKDLVEYELQTIRGVERGVSLKDKLPLGAVVIRERKTQVTKIKYAKVTELDILEEGEFPGDFIPLVPVYGFEVFNDGKREFYSLIHAAKDPQRMLNYWKSTATEVVALQPKAPYIGLKGQFASYPEIWANANRENYPFLEADPVEDSQGNPLPILPQRQQPPTTSGGMMQEAMMSADAIKASLGMFDASLGAQSADISGKAIISRQMQGDNATFHFVDNLSIAIRHVGRILIGIIPLIYSGQRIVRILGEDGTESMVPLNRPVVKQGKGYRIAGPNDGNIMDAISFDAGRYDVVVEVGASYATKRQELANAIVEIARVNPEIMNVAGDLFVKALDVPNADDIAERIRATMPPELLGDDVEAARLQQLAEQLKITQETLAQTENALLAKKRDEQVELAIKQDELLLKGRELEIKDKETNAKIEKMKAETDNTNIKSVEIIASSVEELSGRFADIEGALDILLSAKEAEATGVPETPVKESDNYVRPDIASDGATG